MFPTGGDDLNRIIATESVNLRHELCTSITLELLTHITEHREDLVSGHSGVALQGADHHVSISPINPVLTSDVEPFKRVFINPVAVIDTIAAGYTQPVHAKVRPPQPFKNFKPLLEVVHEKFTGREITRI